MYTRGGFRTLTAICGWVLFLFGCFTLLDGTLALVGAGPCWIVRLGMALTAFLLTSVLGLWSSHAQLRGLATISAWIVFGFGGLALAFGTYSRFTQFDTFKVWQWSLILGGIAVFLAAVIALLSDRQEPPADD